MAIVLTDRAVEEIKSIKEEQNSVNETLIRIVIVGGAAGMRYCSIRYFVYDPLIDNEYEYAESNWLRIKNMIFSDGTEISFYRYSLFQRFFD